ncbi:hypothetical protein GQ43DRAFT_86445 [Delitschia confertaspora ATCC 74209]|uniref:Uncharacterized protein n=1 Tax=Delitschia confertaspora ATCC 74209 TaxID=1513339 RepID=A0A9P4JIT0_9PLEO|nr:hypothetical protein GQ43DRAFT_86445 [Delitschia confertaspora ATCC 74209]
MTSFLHSISLLTIPQPVLVIVVLSGCRTTGETLYYPYRAYDRNEFNPAGMNCTSCVLDDYFFGFSGGPSSIPRRSNSACNMRPAVCRDSGGFTECERRSHIPL